MSDDTLPTFPTYAELAHTSGWNKGATEPVVKDALEITGERYTETLLLGRGGMGKVMLARDARLGREVALKLMHPEVELDHQERARFLREAQVQGQLEHPAIVPVYDIDRRADGSTFFTMRRVVGRTLHEILEQQRTGDAGYTQRELLQAFATVCLAIDYAHSRRVIHRDLKPSNIMLGDFGEVYVLDWGIARILDERPDQATTERLSMPGAMLGTPLYMAPEQMANPDVGPEADVYSLGLILFELLTLQRARDPKSVYAPPEMRMAIRAPGLGIAPELDAICIKATESDPRERYESARALQEAVARYLEGDRDRALRETTAKQHTDTARKLLARGETGEREAVQHLLRASALDPHAVEPVGLLAEAISTPPREMPAEIRARIQTTEHALLRAGMRYAMIATLAWFLFLPFVLGMGIRRGDYLLAVAVPAVLTMVLAGMAAKRGLFGRGYQCATMIVLWLATIGVSRIFGPLILMPTVLVAWAIVVQAHPDLFMRRFGLVGSVVAIGLPIVLEALGVLPASYQFEEGKLSLVPQMTELPEGLTVAMIGVGSAAVAAVPATFVSWLRSELSRSQEREMLRDWKIRQLRDDLVRAPS